MRIGGLGRSRSDQLDTDEREHRDLESRQEVVTIGREDSQWTIGTPQVSDRCGCRPVSRLEVHEDHSYADDDQKQDGDDLDQGEPELDLTKQLDRQQVAAEQSHQENERTDHRPGHVLDPEIKVTGDDNDFCTGRDDPQNPVRPAREVPGPRSEHVSGEILEGLVLEIVEQEFTHGPHHEEEHRPDEQVDQQQRWSRQVNGLARAHEKARSDGAADGDELDVAVLQIPLQMLLPLGGLR